MRTDLDMEQVQLLTAVEQGRVHLDPRFSRPDFERIPDPPFGNRRATQRLRPLKMADLVELVGEAEAGAYGVRPYRLTTRGEQVLAEARAQEATALAEQSLIKEGPTQP